jgi:hypothetical protein
MPTIRFTARTLEALKATPNAQIDYFDRSIPGFHMRISPRGPKTFGVMYRHAGRVRRMTFGTFPPLKLADARERAKEELRKVAKGEDPGAQKAGEREANSSTVLAEDYLNRYAKTKKKSWKEDQRIINNKLNPVIGNITAKCVTPAQIRELLDGIAARAPIEANRTLATVRKIYNWALSQDLVESNPCQGISAPGAEHQRHRVLSEDEIRKLWREFDKETPGVGATFKLRLITAQRGARFFQSNGGRSILKMLGGQSLERNPKTDWPIECR